jgi:hypothetical protein
MREKISVPIEACLKASKRMSAANYCLVLEKSQKKKKEEKSSEHCMDSPAAGGDTTVKDSTDMSKTVRASRSFSGCTTSASVSTSTITDTLCWREESEDGRTAKSIASPERVENVKIATTSVWRKFATDAIAALRALLAGSKRMRKFQLDIVESKNKKKTNNNERDSRIITVLKCVLG